MKERALVVTPLLGIPTVRMGDDLATIVLEGLGQTGIALQSGDIVVVAQKIVSKSEGRVRRLEDVTPSARAREIGETVQKDARLVELILGEAREVLRARPGVIVVEDRRGFIMANAGIDASNVESEGGGETVLLLPADPDASAADLREELRRRTGAEVGVVINDSFGRAWRLGTVGTAIGVAGLPALLDLRGQLDRNGRMLMTTELGVADEVAATASLMMGQGAEGAPVVHLRGFPYCSAEGRAAHLLRPRGMDLFR